MLHIQEGENPGDLIKHWKSNFINEYNSCGEDALTQSIIRSMATQIFESETKERVEKNLPIPKSFSGFINFKYYDQNYNDLLTVLDEVYKKVKDKDQKPMKNKIAQKNKTELYNKLVGALNEFLAKLSKTSRDTNEGGASGSLSFDSASSTYVKDHQIYLIEKTVISDIIGIDVRSFQKCIKCKHFEISLIKIGNICIPMYDYIKSGGNKSFKELLKYYYRINNFGIEHSKKGEICKKCKSSSLEYHNQISTLPEVLIINFNYESYYENASPEMKKEDSFYWVLEEQIDLLNYYDRIADDPSNKNDCYYELTSFVAYFGGDEQGHFINFSKIDDKWYLFDDLMDESILLGSFEILKQIIAIKELSFKYGEKIIGSKLKICFCFYERNRCKGYENYIRKIKEIIKK
jgi:ubiquitin C-terminal hydrolase